MSDIGFPIARISALDLGFKDQLNAYLKREMLVSDEIFQQVREIISGTALEQSVILVEDSGLFIETLGGFPGPYSSYVKEKLGLSGILELLRNNSHRKAKFMAAVGVHHNGKNTFVVGTCEGSISLEIKGAEGFGYDPIFIPDGHQKTFAQLSLHAKNQISHRSQAVNKLVKYLSSV